jgi:hypothetical protein
MLADCVARKLPSEKWPVGRGEVCFLVGRSFSEGGWIFCFEQKYKEIYYAMYLKRQKLSLRVGFDV